METYDKYGRIDFEKWTKMWINPNAQLDNANISKTLSKQGILVRQQNCKLKCKKGLVSVTKMSLIL